MEKNYTIDEILLAVNEIQKREKKNKQNPVIIKKNESIIPKNTLSLIEEAENEIS